MNIKVEVLKVGTSREIKIECPTCGKPNWCVTDMSESRIICWFCKSELRWTVIDEPAVNNWDLTQPRHQKNMKGG